MATKKKSEIDVVICKEIEQSEKIIGQKVCLEEQLNKNCEEKSCEDTSSKECLNEKDCSKEILEENDKKSFDKKNLVVWLSITCGVILLLQYICNKYLSFQFEIKIAVEIASIILAGLVWLGVLKGNIGGEDFDEIKAKIEQTLTKKIDIDDKNATKVKDDEEK